MNTYVPLRSAFLKGVFAASFALGAPIAATAGDIPGDPIVIESGKVQGKQLASGVRAYLGVPFAAPPVRELRWREPQPVAAWTDTYHADRPAPQCMQSLRGSNINHYFGVEAISEDCLYLNVWVPPSLKSGELAPVVVWIYGGAFSVGSASMANYSGESLAKKGVVYVAVAYRLGALGFMAHPELTAESPHRASGNYGFLDQIAGLQWIQRNIARFGGDPKNVTIMGQSAGSMAVSLLQASPLARGLFHRAVGMSGSSLRSGAAGGAQPLAAAEQGGLQLQAALKVPSLEAMRHLSADRILAAPSGGGGPRGPVVDGWMLPEDPAAIFAAGKQNDVPVMVGYTRDEGFSPFGQVKTLAEFQEHAKRYGDQAAELLRLYPASTDAEARRAAVDIGRDSSVGLQMREWARSQIATGKSRAYLYVFSRVHPYAPGITFADHNPATVGAYHTGDVPYWLQTLDSLNLFRVTRNWTDYDRELAERMSDAIVSFARDGAPKMDGIEWPAYRKDAERVMEFGDSVRVIPLPNSKKIDFLAAATPAAPAPPTGGAARARD